MLGFSRRSRVAEDATQEFITLVSAVHEAAGVLNEQNAARIRAQMLTVQGKLEDLLGRLR